MAARLDVRVRGSRLEEALAPVREASHLYYFATTPIFVAQRGCFDDELFRRFAEVYVEGFARLVTVLLPRGLRVAFYPSSTAVDEQPLDMGEYVAAKVAGEALCRFLERTQPGLTVLSPRLPRLPTDQTRSLLPAKEEDAVATLLAHLRRA